MSEDTIAAIATASGASGIGIIRISGPKALDIAQSLMFTKSGKEQEILSQPSHTVKYGFIFDGKEPVDEVLLTVFRAPRSYTAEDTVEISCHGGTFVLRRILSLVVRSGARLAEPGEFTKRAFMNGRIDLTEAESVMDIISSGNEFARKNALSVLRGGIYEKIKDLRDRLIHETAFIEAALDDPEHYSLEGYGEKLKEVINGLLSDIDRMIALSDTGRVLKNGIKTVIAGKPNVGKSSILNLLSGEDRAIVTEIPGTTRDVLVSEISLEGVPLILYDTAGIRETEDKVEKIGVERSKKYIEEADLVLFTLDSSTVTEKEDMEIYDCIREYGKKCIILLNKTDLGNSVTDSSKFSYPVIAFSAREEQGISELKEKIGELFFSGAFSSAEDVYVTGERQIEELKSAAESLKLVIKSIDEKLTEDFYTVDLMDAYSHLGNIIGEDTDDALFDRIFKEFCMGK
ncbi:MAG: tRNA uridine-5-carboxymethylaminomethyl(34) synthesis GTPase MnmE [Lachnospiraceae bacterium]|nr:tRNA uridine-5-carboxymethylaminomethyl(34) synthesis GTPase MnmE [Lachnospiraceae bacterium]